MIRCRSQSTGEVILGSDLLEVFLNVLHCLSAQMLAVVYASEAKNADAVRVVKLLFHVASTCLKHCWHLHSTAHNQLNYCCPPSVVLTDRMHCLSLITQG